MISSITEIFSSFELLELWSEMPSINKSESFIFFNVSGWSELFSRQFWPKTKGYFDWIKVIHNNEYINKGYILTNIY